MKKLAIIHFQPIELYPPVTNIIRYIETHNAANIEVRVFTTIPTPKQIIFHSDTVVIQRYKNPGEPSGVVLRLYRYLVFYLQFFFKLLNYRPTEILYFETLSFLPVYLYQLFTRPLRKNSRIFCHYHEYMSVNEYQNGMFLTRFINKLEKLCYAHMEWISHTNEDRIRLFKIDNKGFDFNNTQVLPNYPPAKWLDHNRQNEGGFPIRIVYAGALGMDTMYIKEFASWVENNNGSIIWDIYSLQNADALLAYLSSIGSRFIHFRGKIDYYELPRILKMYNVGVILYKGHIPNYIYNAPNKLFEYYACGLDTWFPAEMKSSLSYVTKGVFPKIIPVDFQNLQQFDLNQAIARCGLRFQESQYICENVLGTLWKKISMS